MTDQQKIMTEIYDKQLQRGWVGAYDVERVENDYRYERTRPDSLPEFVASLSQAARELDVNRSWLSNEMQKSEAPKQTDNGWPLREIWLFLALIRCIRTGFGNEVFIARFIEENTKETEA